MTLVLLLTWIYPRKDVYELDAEIFLPLNLSLLQLVVEVSGHVSHMRDQLGLDPHAEEVVRVQLGEALAQVGLVARDQLGAPEN